ncbi:hypothetical protein ACJRO7_002500 [Eucalyptus globulus]|uniref:Prolamin-like domain-containing protein n=1 Tax=Eucalyptus globulus TaxID=34317 RepID=A0ABD3LUN5_EUCGL
MVSSRRASLLLTFTVTVMAITPALSQTTGGGLPGFPPTSQLECWKIINSVAGCTEQLLKSFEELKFDFLPDCCKAIIGIPSPCAQWIFPFGLSLGEQVNKYCTNLLGAVPSPAS